jgi:hypothetical protein
MISPEEANEYTSQLSITIEELKEDWEQIKSFSEEYKEKLVGHEEHPSKKKEEFREDEICDANNKYWESDKTFIRVSKRDL